ncbi:MAG: hypothetical protein WCA46_23615 [Actinocatenispora sp.]
MVDVLGAMVGVLVIAGAIGLFVTRGSSHVLIKKKLWKLIGIAVLVLLTIGYLRAHSK